MQRALLKQTVSVGECYCAVSREPAADLTNNRIARLAHSALPLPLLKQGFKLGDRLEVAGPTDGSLYPDQFVQIETPAGRAEHR